MGALTPERLTAQLLAGPPASDPVAVAERLLAVQGQDPRGVRLAIRARTTGLRGADVDRALTEDRSLVITWLNRGTLHLVRSEDYAWLHALTGPRLLTSTMRRLAQLDVAPDDADRGVALIEQALADEGPLIRDQLAERVAQAGIRTEGQALIHILALASIRGVVVRGPMVGRRHAYVLVRDWLGEQGPVDRARALAELARRYLAGHGPADDRDLAKWAGLPLRDVRAGLGSIAPELEQRDDGLLDLAGRAPAARARTGVDLPPPRLLGSFEPVLLGWVSREPLLGHDQQAIIVGGIFRPFALVGGRAVATWRLARTPAGGSEVELEPFGRLRPADAEALEAEAADVLRFFADG